MQSKNQEAEKLPWQDAETIPRYTIGQLAALFDIHPQSLRYFETVNLIRPERDRENGRRIYSNHDMFEIIERLKYKNLGFSVRESEKLLKTGSFEETAAWMEQCEKRLEKEQKRLELLRGGLLRMKESVERIEPMLNRCAYQIRPPMYLHLYQDNGRYVTTPGAVEARKMFIDFQPLSFYLFEFPTDKEPPKTYLWNVAMEEKAAEQTGFCDLPKVQKIESEPCIYTIFKLCGGDGISRDCYEPAMRFIAQNGWRAHGKTYGRLITTVQKNSSSERYFEAWIPIKN